MLDILAHPLVLWLLGLAGTYTTQRAAKRTPPWVWIRIHPGRTLRTLIGSLAALGLLHAAGTLDAQPWAGLLAFGTGALGTEILDRLLETSRSAVRTALDRLASAAGRGGQGGNTSLHALGWTVAGAGAVAVTLLSPQAAWWILAAIASGVPILAVLDARRCGSAPGVGLAVGYGFALWVVLLAWWVGEALVR